MNINNNSANQEHAFLQAYLGNNTVDLNSRGGKIATNYLDQNGPITLQQVRDLKNAFTNDIENDLDQNQYEPSVFDEKIEILNLLSKLADGNTVNLLGIPYYLQDFTGIAEKDGKAGLSSADLRATYG